MKLPLKWMASTETLSHLAKNVAPKNLYMIILSPTKLQRCDQYNFNVFRTHFWNPEKVNWQKHARKISSLSQFLVSSKQGYKNWVKTNGPETLLPGLNMTNEQLLFVSYAQVGGRDPRHFIPIVLHMNYLDIAGFRSKLEWPSTRF